MDMNGEARIPAPQAVVWDALNDPEALKAAITGCEELERDGENAFIAKVRTKIGPVSARFGGRVELSDLDPPNSYRISGEGTGGAAGFAKGGAVVRLIADGPDVTILKYDVDASVGGKLAQIGSRLIDGAARKMAADFFEKFGVIAAERAAAAASAQPAVAAPPPAVAAPIPASPPAPAPQALHSDTPMQQAAPYQATVTPTPTFPAATAATPASPGVKLHTATQTTPTTAQPAPVATPAPVAAPASAASPTPSTTPPAAAPIAPPPQQAEQTAPPQETVWSSSEAQIAEDAAAEDSRPTIPPDPNSGLPGLMWVAGIGLTVAILLFVLLG